MRKISGNLWHCSKCGAGVPIERKRCEICGHKRFEVSGGNTIELQEPKLSLEGGRSGLSHPVTLLSSPSPAKPKHNPDGTVSSTEGVEGRGQVEIY
jgi:hypothetical protein